jgi:eukaryotic-like serine/threonine-protein kinase
MAPALEDFRAQASPKDGALLGERYRIVGLLGTGGTAEVYLAVDETIGAPVVVKWLFTQAARDPQHRLRFVLGARATMAVEHPAVARVFAVEEPLDEPPYVVMEALVGEPLSAYLEAHGAMPEPLALAIGREVAKGIAAAHAAGIVHRDLKPGNLFLVEQPGLPPHVKIIDFGFAKDTRDPEAGPSSTNLVLGTAQYMAPEQVLADPVDGRTDVYGFGVVLFRLVTGHLPFDLDVGVDLFSHQIFSPSPPPSWLVEGLDADLEQVILRCMRKHPENRYPSMDAVLADLERIASGGEISPLPLERDPDVYKPKNHSGRAAAETLAARFGTEAPPPPTSRLDPESVGARRGR